MVSIIRRSLLSPLRSAIRWGWRQLAGLIPPTAARQRRREAQQHASAILSELSRLGFTRKVTVKKRTRRQRVKFDYPLLFTHDELWCPIDLVHLPTGVRTDELKDATTLESLEDRLHTPIRVDYLANGKLCYVVRLGGSQFPEKFPINLFEMPEDAPPLAVPFGITADGDHLAVDLLSLKHLLIAGATGGGKTTFYHALISTLVNRNPLEDLELRLIDLKRTEFNLYKPLLGKRGQGGIVSHLAVDPEDAIDVLEATFREIDRRNKLMEQHNATNLHDLAQSTGIRLKRIVLLVDEFALLTLNPTRLGKQSIGTIATNLMARIAALGRSAGVAVIIATQMVNKEVLSGIIRANFENRLCLSTADWRQSQLVVESSEADGLPPGRAILRVEGKTREVQTCYITARQVRIEVDRISEFGPDGAWGEDLEKDRFLRDAKLLLQAACQHLNGEMARAKILQLDGVRGVVSQDRFQEIAQRLERDGVLEAGGPRKPRRVARAFFGRVGLLDSLYGTVGNQPFGENRMETVVEGEVLQLPPSINEMSHQDASENDDEDDSVTVYGSESEPTMHNVQQEELPAWMVEQIDKISAEVQDTPKKRSRRKN